MSEDDIHWMAIGFYKPSVDAEYQWTDSTAVTYTNWDQYYSSRPQGNNGTYFGVFGPENGFYRLENGCWDDEDESMLREFGICQLSLS